MVINRLYCRIFVRNLEIKNTMSYLKTPRGYKPLLDARQTELGIKRIKDFFQSSLSAELRLRRVTAPLFVLQGQGINDDLNGIERAVSFPIKDLGDQRAEVVHSLAKWKRLMLSEYEIDESERAFEVAQKIVKDKRDEKTLKRLQGSLARNGFYWDAISYALKQLGHEEDEDWNE